MSVVVILLQWFFGWYTIHDLDYMITKGKKRFDMDKPILAALIIYFDIFFAVIGIFSACFTSPEESE